MRGGWMECAAGVVLVAGLASVGSSAPDDDLDWLLALLPAEGAIDGAVLRDAFDRMDVRADGAVSYLEFRDASGQGLGRFRSLDVDRSGTLSREECELPWVLAAERSARDVSDEVMQRLLVQDIQASVPTTSDAVLKMPDDPVVAAALRALGFAHLAPAASAPTAMPTTPGMHLAVRKGDPRQVADQLAAALWPLPAPRAPSGRGWGVEFDSVGE